MALSLEDYWTHIVSHCENHMPVIKKTTKVSDANIVVPTAHTYDTLVYNNYNVAQLKSFAKHYKLKVTGNKPQLQSRLYCFLRLSSYIIKIQKVFRRALVDKYKRLHGPASLTRSLCTNADDFVSMEPLTDIPFHQFISYKDVDGFVYGFDITSLHNLYLKSSDDLKNPYNRNRIPDYVFANIRALIRLGKILRIHINLSFEDDLQHLTTEKMVEIKAVTLFQHIDSLGNYSNANWFLSLHRVQLVKFVHDLVDIWNYRAQLSNEVKRTICPPHGDPFRGIRTAYIMTEPNLWSVKKTVLDIMDRLVNSGADRDSKALGAYYVLGALTLVNTDASTSLPWLFQSMNYF